MSVLLYWSKYERQGRNPSYCWQPILLYKSPLIFSQEAKRSNTAITQLLLARTTMGVILRDPVAAVHKLQRAVWNVRKWPRANVFEAVPITQLKQLLAVTCQKIFILKQTSSNLYMIFSSSVNKFLSNYLSASHWHAFTKVWHWPAVWNLTRAKCKCFRSSVEHVAKQSLAVKNKTILQQLKPTNLSIMIHLTLYLSTSHCVHKCFTLTGYLKSAKSECFWSNAEHSVCLKQLLAVEKYIYAKAKIFKFLHGML